jgi:phospholipase C
MASNGLSKIQHIVVLMLENRSFDNLLGFLYADRGNVSPLGHPFEGLTGKETNPAKGGKQVQVFGIKKEDPLSYFMPRGNPGEGFQNTNVQLFGTTTPAPTAKATNQGFVTNFEYVLSKNKAHALPGTEATDIMGIYTPEMLPILSGMARGYAVCDHWYSSAPTETFPNRAFVAMATSQGRLGDAPAPFTAPSIYSLLTKKGHTWAVYGDDALPLSRGSVADITHAPNSNFGDFKAFQAAAKNGTLPNYVFLEPQWGSKGNSQHPNDDVSKGEQYLQQVYYALYGSKVWEKTLLIVTYDEHGGCYDHVVPPNGATTPDNSVGEFGFDFKRFGLRVPTILISPWIAAGTVYRVPASNKGKKGSVPFDHTSILATVEKRFGLPNLTARDAAAPDVGGVLTLAKARTDDPLKGLTPPTSKTQPPASKEPTHLEMAVAQTMAALPVGSDEKGYVHQHELPACETGAQCMAYARKRYRAFYKRHEQVEKRAKRS